MKITKSQLKQIIKEELEAIQEETLEQLVGKLEVEGRKMNHFGAGPHKTLLNVKKLLKKIVEMAQEKGWEDPFTKAQKAIAMIDELNKEGLLTQLETLPRRHPDRNRLRAELKEFWDASSEKIQISIVDTLERISRSIIDRRRSIASSKLKQTFEL